MYITEIDNLFDNLLNKFYNYTIEKKLFEFIKKDINFVKYQNDILNYIKDFIKSINHNDIIKIIKNSKYINSIINIIKRYCAYYIYLGLSYHYEGGRDLFITNIIEISRYQKDSVYIIPEFFNSDTNSNIISLYNDIKNLLSLIYIKDIDKIKIILLNNVIKYNSTINLFNELGEDYISNYFLIKDNFHNIIKTLIFKKFYLK